jgi:hypothetical protein
MLFEKFRFMQILKSDDDDDDDDDDGDTLEAFDAMGSWCYIERVSVSGKANTDRQSLSWY